MEHQIGSLPATVVRPETEQAPPVFLVHGLGMGRWVFEDFQQVLAQHGVPSVAVDLPGHGADVGSNPPLERVLDALTRAVRDVPGCALLGHSGGGYLAQVVAGRADPALLVLVNAWPTDGVGLSPNRLWLSLIRRHGLRLLGEGPIELSFEDWQAIGLDRAGESEQRAIHQRFGPIPSRLLRDLLRRPYRVDPGAVRCQTLSCTGKEDALLHWQVGRRIGEWYGGVIWRYDDLGHLPWFEAGADRLYTQVAEYVVKPQGRKVTEADAWAPTEGRGAEARDIERGEEGARRSAYGQRLGRQGERATARWDQNLTER